LNRPTRDSSDSRLPLAAPAAAGAWVARPARLARLLRVAHVFPISPAAAGAVRRVALLALALLAALPALCPAPLRAQESFGPSVVGYGFGQNKIAYRKFEWHVYHSPHFNVHYYSAEESSLQKVVSFAESDYDDVSRFLNFQIKEPIPLIFFATHSAFEQNNIILDFIPEGVGAFASPVRFRMVMPIDDPDGETIAIMRHELTHIFQYHMLFQGSAHVGTNDHFRYVQQVGGVANGSTWYDRTNYYETLPAHQLDLGLWLESDRMGFLLPAITAENLETQRQVVMNERRQRIENQPYGLAGERLRELLYPPDHPYHWPVIGYMDDIAAATLDEVRAFFRTYYAPNNAVLTLAGDFDPAAALERIDAWFGDIPAGPPVPALPAMVGDPPPLPASAAQRRAVLEDDVNLARIYLACRAPAFGQRLW